MGSKFRGVKTTKNKTLSTVEVEEKLSEISDSTKIREAALEAQTILNEESREKPTPELTQHVYAYVREGVKGFKVFKIGFDPESGYAKVVDSQDADHNVIGISFTTNQMGLKNLFDRKNRGSSFT